MSWPKPHRRFADRLEAGRVLASHCDAYRDRGDVIVLALPRGGVPVAYEVASALHAPLDVFLVRKLGVPGREELAMGAVASGGVLVLNHDVVQLLGLGTDAMQRVADREGAELRRRESAYRGARPMPDLAARTVLLVDDGVATGASMRAAVESVRQHAPERVVVAVPTAPRSACDELGAVADEVVCARTPVPFLAVGAHYADFTQTTDAEVIELLRRAADKRGG